MNTIKRNKFTSTIAVICLVSHLTTQVGADRVVSSYYLAPASTFAAPEISHAAVGEQLPSRRPSGKRGLGAKLAPVCLALASVLPGAMGIGAAMLASATPVYAQDAPSQRVRNLINQLKLATRSQEIQETQSAIQILEQIRALEPREKLAALNSLIEQMNSSEMDYDKKPEILDALLETVFSIIESNRGQMFQLRLVRESSGRERAIYIHPEEVQASQVPDVLMREMARRMRKVARGEPPAADHSDDVETRLAGQSFRLYFPAARAGLIQLDLDLIDEFTQLLTGSPDRFHRRIIFGLVQGIGEAPADSATLSRARDWLARLERFCQSQGSWGAANQAYVVRLFRTVRESLSRRALEDISLPAETFVDRDPPAPATPLPAVPPSQAEIKRSFPISIFRGLLVALGIGGLVYYIFKKIRTGQFRQRIGVVENPNLATLLPEKPTVFQAPKLKEIEVQKYLPQAPAVPLTQATTFGAFKVAPYIQADALGIAPRTKPGVYSVFASHIGTITASQRGYYFLFQNTESHDPFGRRQVQALDSVTGQMVSLKEVLLYDDQRRIKRRLWLNDSHQVQWNGGILHRVWDEVSQREIILLKLGTLLFSPTPISEDPLKKNFNYWAYDLGDRKETAFYETGNFLIEVGASGAPQAGSILRAWDWQSRAQTTVTKFNGLYFVKNLGRGGMGRVDLAWDPTTLRFVAVKLLLSDLAFDDEFARRFIREAELMGNLNHPNILPIHKAGAQPTLHYIMPVVDGANIHSLFKQKQKEGKTFSFSQTLEILIQAGRGVSYLHEFQQDGKPLKIVHRDLKPENLFLNRDGRVMVADFGTAHVDARTQLTQTGTIMGTPVYMSPEQIEDSKKVDARTDIYALGVILYVLSTGRTPWEEIKSQVLQLCNKKRTSDTHDRYPKISDLKPECPPGLDDIARKAMAFRAEDRYQTAEEMIRDLEALRADPTKRFDVKVQMSEKKKFKLKVAAALAAVVGLLGFLAWLASGRPPRGREPSVAPTTTEVESKAPWLTWVQLEEMSVDEAIARLNGEIDERGGEREAGRSYYYRARLKIQQAQALADPNACHRAYEEALEDLERAASLMPELRGNPRNYFLKAVIYAGLGDQQRMLECLDQFDRALQHAADPGEFRDEKEKADELRARVRALQQTGFRLPNLDPRHENPFNLAA